MTSPSTDRRLGLTGDKAYKAPVTVATTANITLYGEQTIDGVSVLAINAAGYPDRVLVKEQTNPIENGIWDVSTAGWNRSPDCNTTQDLVKGTQVLVSVGNTQVNQIYILNGVNPIIPGVSALTFIQSFVPILSVNLFGATGDGITDDTAAIQAAINYAQSNNTTLNIPSVIASYRLTSDLNVTAGLTIQGDGWSPYTPSDFNTRGAGSWFFFDHAGKGFNITNGSTTVTSVILSRIGTLRNQAAPAVGWAPLATDYDIFIGNADVHLEKVMLWNPSYAVHIDGDAGGRLHVDGLYGQPLIRGLFLENVQDSCHINNVHFWPWWTNDTAYVRPYMLTHLFPLVMERCDNPLISNFFCIFCVDGITFGSNAHGFTQRALLTNVGVDNFSSNAVSVLAGADGTSLQITNMYGYSSGGTDGVYVGADNCLLQISNMRLSGLGNSASSLNGTGNRAQYDNWIIDGYNGNNVAAPVFYTNGGCRTMVSDMPYITSSFPAAFHNNATFTSINAILVRDIFSIANPATSQVVTHSLGFAPLAHQISLQPTDSGTPSYLYVDTITSTQFTVHALPSPAGNANGNWIIDGRL